MITTTKRTVQARRRDRAARHSQGATDRRAPSSPEQATSKLIDHAVGAGASDLFLVTNEQHLAVLVRHLGIVRTISIVPLEQAKRILSHIKANSGMDLSEKRQPADGRWIYEKDDQTIDLRINIIPTLYGEDFAIRLFTRDASIYSLEKLGMGREQLQQYQSMITSPSGLILITGPPARARPQRSTRR
jgi:type II secretory ATPase GspE/PulE/Tfp pilus assembly ATPase PilB-like protein